jgi:MYXO-CTERM domain-containing protein
LVGFVRRTRRRLENRLHTIFGHENCLLTLHLRECSDVASFARMSTYSAARALSFASFAAFTAFASAAAAHISLEQGGTHMSRYGDGSDKLKGAPCGVAGGTRGTNVYTYQGGETISVSLAEYIPHPSYFRIAFDDDGDDDFAEPASIEPIDPMRPCPVNAADKCGAPDYYNNATVLPMMDNLDPHVTASLGQSYTWDVHLPKVECDNCTLQILQVMEDTIHGAYNPTPGDPNDNPYVADIYHQCIDLVLTAAHTDDAGAEPTKKPAEAKSSGCSMSTGQTPSAGALAAALGVVVTALRRRARSED